LAQKRFIAIAGNIGAGKTELTAFLCRKYGLTPFFEPNEQNPYLADFYRDMKRWAFASQIFFLARRFRLQLELEQVAGTVVQDRTVYEDAEIFARHLHQKRLINRRDFQTYWELYQSIAKSLAPPDLLIFLRCQVRALRRRIRLRGRSMERDIPGGYLSRLNRLYDEWFNQYHASPVLVLSTDRLDYLTDLVDRVDLLRKVEKYL
jgi:deoxyadenosine/deoxycytidine kinase